MRGQIFYLALGATTCLAQSLPFISPHWSQTAAPSSSSYPLYNWPYGHPTGPCITVQTESHPPFSRTTTTWSTQTSSIGTPACPTIQYEFSTTLHSNSSRADAVKSAYLRSWEQYSKHCFGHDTLIVTNNSCIDDLFGWGATIVDAVDTAIIMGLSDIVHTQLAYIASIDFTQTGNGASQLVNTFDVVIRYLGGLLSAYDLLTSHAYASAGYQPYHVSALLRQAVILADVIKPQFATLTGLPAGGIWFNNGSLEYSTYLNPLDNQTYRNTGPAVAGTIILEFYRLSDLTGDDSYRQLADRAEAWILNPYPEPAYPYLVGRQMDVDTGNFITYNFGWSAEIDSFFEYLIKSHIYNPEASTSAEHLSFWLNALESTYNNIVVHPYRWLNLTFITEGDPAANMMFSMDTYSCFAGGNILYGSTYLENLGYMTTFDLPSFKSLGLEVAASCRHLYATTVSGLGPAVWSWFDTYNQTYNESWAADGDNQYSAETRGYFIRNAKYYSFPETIESIFYAWRLTGEEIYRDWNWEIFQSLMKESNTEKGGDVVYGGLEDADVPVLFEETLETFYFAEVLKYLFLTFVEPETISLDAWVFNTEAHPLRIGGRRSCIKS